jgi:hypothetical protein
MGCSAAYGCVVYIDDGGVKFTSCQFISSTASKSKGGNDIFCEEEKKEFPLKSTNYVSCCSTSTESSFTEVCFKHFHFDIKFFFFFFI